jgi:hypothetical protein
MFRRITIAAGVAILAATGCPAQNFAKEQGREIPAYVLPVPEDVSPRDRDDLAVAADHAGRRQLASGREGTASVSVTRAKALAVALA